MQLSVFQIITFNYFSALLLTYFTYQPELTFKEKTIPYSLFIGLAILLPIVFLIQAKSIKEVGIVKTDIAQRLSLFIPLTASYFLFNETFSQLKIIGFIIGFSAIFFTFSHRPTPALKPLSTVAGIDGTVISPLWRLFVHPADSPKEGIQPLRACSMLLRAMAVRRMAMARL